MCGGSGTRLWPLSRTCMPKQFVSLVEGDPTTFQSTVLRVAGACGFGRPTVVAPVANRHVVVEQMLAVGAWADVILEPEGRDSCAAVAVAALHAFRLAPEAVVLVMSADHFVDDVTGFVRACTEAAVLAGEGHVVVFGTAPDRAAPEFGYILPGETIGAGPAARVARFFEKPDAARATALASDGALWNAGYFLFRADVMIEEMDRHVPEVMGAVRAALDGAIAERDALSLGTAGFADAPKLSFDRAVMEATGRAVVFPIGFRWLDIGTWGSLWDASAKDGNGNALHGRVHARETRDSIVRSQGGLLTAVLGLEGVVVVTTDDAVLVTTRERAGEVKELVGALRAESSPETDDHLRMHRPWGWYQRIDVGARFQVKRIMVRPKGRLSLQKHHHRAEHWVVVRGTAEVTVDGIVTLVHENESVQLPIGCVHRLANPGKISLELVEIQVGSYTGEDDIVRFDDDYGR
ncbi:mannose-1-phosphate guanylyltransferase/mannose-6-phosphate isomerase [Methylobacterium sp. E-016]|nr:mannose-1-phosphate guanylyltransferase/mannose-6-phosphate isomerase [Methylobacterium sp. E-016]